jgi:hypothetical protein
MLTNPSHYFALDLVCRGVRITNSATTFAEIDRDNCGMILFEEFADWAIHQHLASLLEAEALVAPMPSASTKPVDIALVVASPRMSVSVPELVSVFLQGSHAAFAQKLFAIYSTKNQHHSTLQDGSQFETVSYDLSHMDQGEVLLALKHCNIVPQWASKEAASNAYFQVVLRFCFEFLHLSFVYFMLCNG